MVETVTYVCPVDGCPFSARSSEELRGHMASVMQNDDRHKWENVPISHHDLSAAKKTVENADLGEFGP